MIYRYIYIYTHTLNSPRKGIYYRDRITRWWSTEIYPTTSNVVSLDVVLHPWRPSSTWLLGGSQIVRNISSWASWNHRENGPFKGDTPNKYPQYMVYVSWLLMVPQGTTPRVSAVSLWWNRLCQIIIRAPSPCTPQNEDIQYLGSMHGISFTYIWLICMVNVGKHTIHGSYW